MAHLPSMVDMHLHHQGYSHKDTKINQLSSRRSSLRNRAHIKPKSLLLKLLKANLFQATFTIRTVKVASLVAVMFSPITFSIMIMQLLMMLSVLNLMLLLLLMLAKSLLLIMLNLIMDKMLLIQMALSGVKLLNSSMKMNLSVILTSLLLADSNKPQLRTLANPVLNSKKVD